LQCDPGSKDGLALRRSDLVVRELGAFLELLVDDSPGSLVTAMKPAFSSS
jgi:hypothetical protein